MARLIIYLSGATTLHVIVYIHMSQAALPTTAACLVPRNFFFTH